MNASAEISAFVRQVRYEADGVLSFQLERSHGGDLPPWDPGAHVEIVLPSGLQRQYSLCGDPADLTAYRIAVRLIAEGRGGSTQMHRLRPGDEVVLRAVRNHFELQPAASYLFIAAGIGITPLLPMLASVGRQALPAEFVYLGRNDAQMAFLSELAAYDNVTVVRTDVSGIPRAADLLAGSTAERVYACGPAGLLDDLEAAAQLLLDDRRALHSERFAAVRAPSTKDDEDRKIVCSRSGVTVAVEPGETYLEAIRRAGIDVPSSCEMGICGTCELAVTAGDPDHQDMLLTEQERAAGAFLPCVSRSLSTELTIDV